MKYKFRANFIKFSLYTPLLITVHAFGSNQNSMDFLCAKPEANVSILCTSNYTNDGNFFGQAGVIGTNDNYDLSLETNNSIKMTVKTDGKIGIGTTTPTALLEVAGQIKITGGSPGAGKVLTSDATGLASWTTPNTGNGTVTNVTSGNSYLSIATGDTTPVITANVGTTANTLAAGNDSRIAGALQLSSYLADVTGAATCTAAEKPAWNMTTDQWECSSIGSLNASVITAGTVATARLGSGTANSTTFLRGDGTWATISGGGGGASQWTTTGNDIYYSTGSVGIGTSTPSAKLDVQNTLSSSSGVLYGTRIQPTINQSGSAAYTSLLVNTVETTTGSGAKLLLDLQTNGTSQFKVDSSGTITAANNINGNWGLFSGSILSSGYMSSAYATYVAYTATGSTAYPSSPGGSIKTENYSWGDGNYTTQTFTVNNSSGRNQNAYIAAVSTTGSGSYTPALVFGLQNGSSAYAETMRIDSNGNVGIGVTSPSSRLQVAGGITPALDANYALGSSGLRFTTVYAQNGTINTSDAREKKEIKDSDLGLDFISKLRPVVYRWKNGNDSALHYGLIAQETEKVITDQTGRSDLSIVTHDKKTDRYGLRYSELVSPLIKAAQELNQNKADRTEIENLKKENANLLARLEALEKAIQKK